MVWSASPADSRTIATGIAVLAWTIASVFALRGLTLRRRVIGRPAKVSVRPEIHIPVPYPVPAEPADQHPHNGCPFQH